MDYDLLLEGCCEMGCEMLGCGAEIYRVEDTVHRILAAYNIAGEVFAIPNCLIISIADGEGHLHTRMHRATPPQNDIALLESLNALSRQLCSDPPQDPGELLRRVFLIRERHTTFPVGMKLFGYFLGSMFFSLFFGGGFMEAVAAGLAGFTAGLCVTMLDKIHCNYFIATVAGGFSLAFLAYFFLSVGIQLDVESVITGGLMALVPGLVFTNFLTDLLSGDVIAGLSTFVRAMLSACAIALGTCLAMALCRHFSILESSGTEVSYGPLLNCVFAAVGCYGYCFPFNIHGKGALLCCLGGGLGWLVYELLVPCVGNVYAPAFFAAAVVAAYAEIMARVRRCPVTAYLLVSFFPLVPGLTIYQAMDYGLRGELELFWSSFFQTFGVAGCLAIGSLLVTSFVRILHHRRTPR